MHIHKAISGLKMRLTFKFTIFYFNWSLFVCRNIRIGNAYSMNETRSFFFALSLSSKYSDSWDCFFFEFRSLSFSFDLIPTENNFFFFSINQQITWANNVHQIQTTLLKCLFRLTMCHLKSFACVRFRNHTEQEEMCASFHLYFICLSFGRSVYQPLGRSINPLTTLE